MGESVKAPAIALMVTTGLGMLMSVFSIGVVVLGMGMDAIQLQNFTQQFGDDALVSSVLPGLLSGTIGTAANLVAMVIDVVVLIGAINMYQQRNRAFAMTACIISMIPCITPCCIILGLPFGIWGLVAIHQEP